MNLIKIRLMKETDLDYLAEIYVRSYDNADIGEKWTKEAARKLIYYWYKKQRDLAFVAEFDGKIVGGLISGVKPWWDGPHLSDGELFVDPGYQKKGIGSLLMKRLCENAMKKYGAVRLDAFTYRNNTFPLSWYNSIGLEEVKEWAIVSGELKEINKKLKR